MNESYFAEAGTDKYLRETFFPDWSFHGTMCEIGGGDPVAISMSRHWVLNGWKAVIVEPNPTFAQKHRDIGNEVHEVACGEEPAESVRFTVVDGAEMSWSSFKPRDGLVPWQNEPCHEIVVRKERLDDVLERSGLTISTFSSSTSRAGRWRS